MSVKREFVKGMFFVAAAKYSGLVIGIVISSILSRLLTPSDYGVIAIAMTFIGFFGLLGDMGIGPAIVQYKQLDKKQLGSIFGFTFWIGLLVAGIFFLCSGWFASFYDNAQLKPICQCLSIMVFMGIFGIVPGALLNKHKRFDLIAYRSVSVQILCGALGIWAAFSGWGTYALLIAPILGGLITFSINWAYCKIPLRLIPEFAPLKMIASFSTYQFLFNFINYWSRNLDKMLIGKILNLSELGYFEKSNRLMMMPVSHLTGVISPVIHPYLSDWQNDPARILSFFKRTAAILFTLSFPIAAFLSMSAKEIILIIFGNQWGPAVMPFAILSITVAFQIPGVICGSISQACGKTKVLFYVGLFNTCLALTGYLVTMLVWKSLIALCIGAAISSFLCFFISYGGTSYFCFEKLSPFAILKGAVKPAIYSIMLAVLLYIVSQYNWNDSLILSLLVKVVVFIIATIVFVRFFTPYRWSMIKSVFSRK